jgi:hypothetical protein
MLTITATVDFPLTDEDDVNSPQLGAEVVIRGNNMGEELAVAVAKQAICMESGLDLESFGYSYMEEDADVELEPSQAIVRFLAL